MNLLETIKRILSFQGWEEASALPGWRARPSRMRHLRRPFGSSRLHKIGKQEMTVEEFQDKDLRDARFRELRAAKGSHDISKFSTVRGRQNIWCVVRP